MNDKGHSKRDHKKIPKATLRYLVVGGTLGLMFVSIIIFGCIFCAVGWPCEYCFVEFLNSRRNLLAYIFILSIISFLVGAVLPTLSKKE